MCFYCQIEISDRFLLLNYAIYFYLLDYLFWFGSKNLLSKK